MDEQSWKQVLRHEKTPVLELFLRRPKCSGETRAQRRMERYYAQMAEQWKTRWQGALYTQACAALALAQADGRAFRPWRARLDYRVMLETEGLLSLSIEATEETGHGPPAAVRSACTWELATGTPAPLTAFLPAKERGRRRVVAGVRALVEQRRQEGLCLLDDGCEAMLGKEFDPDRFYLTPEGVEIFYPMFLLGPYAEGFPSFLVADAARYQPQPPPCD